MTDDFEKYQLGDTHTSVGVRFEMWRAAVREFKESPIIGLGFERRSEFRKELRKEGYIVSLDGTGSAHSDFFDAISKRGIIGLIASTALYLIPVIMIFRKFLKSEGSEIYILGLCLVFIYAINGLTETFLYRHNSAMLYICLLYTSPSPRDS